MRSAAPQRLSITCLVMMMDLGNDDRFHQVGNLPENLDTVYNFDFQNLSQADSDGSGHDMVWLDLSARY